jgi:ABC-type transport system involved in cytochrome c biogenesis ATPase subunit
VLTAVGVWWRHGRSPWLLRDLSVTVGPGELLRVRGGNGTGKSTLLRLLAGVLEPHRGRVHRAGPAGHLPQGARALPPVPAGRLARSLAGRAPADPDLARHLGTRADRLSGGTGRRVLLDAVLALPVRLLVLDEPEAGLDAAAAARLAAVLTGRLAAGTAVVLAEHRPLDLAGGRVLDLGLGPAPAPPGDVRVTLGGTGALRGRTAADGRLVLTVPEGERDALLREALAAGWAVLTVTPPTPR